LALGGEKLWRSFSSLQNMICHISCEASILKKC
jgi:hypothetical protein